MKTPAISIVTVCRNSGQELLAFSSSILSALGPQDEWVIQDGASEDGSVDFLRSLSDSRVRLTSYPDAGIYDAMNRATSRSTGDFVLILGADDRLRIHLDEARVFLQNSQMVFYGDVWRVTSRDRFAGAFDGAKLARTNICQQAIFYPRTAFAGRAFDLRYTQQADWVFNMDCFADPALTFQYIPLLVADFAQGGVSSLNMDDTFQRDYRRLLRKHFSFRQRWCPELASFLSDVFRSLPGVSPPRQTPARAR